MKWILLALISLNLFSCASYFKRKTCESTNWYEYGKGVALEGRRLTGDEFILECQKADAEISESLLDQGFKAGLQMYCTPDGIYKVGREGNFFNTEMCEGDGQMNLLRARYNAGVLDYCQKSNGYSAGASGKAYNKICPNNLEKDFLSEFNRGRRKYLQTVISQNQSQISELEQKSSQTQSELNSKRTQLASVSSRSAQNIMGAAATQRQNQLSSEINSLDYTYRSYQNQITDLKEKNRKFQLELVQLGN